MDQPPISPRRAFRAALAAQAALEDQEARAVLAERAAQAALALTSPAAHPPTTAPESLTTQSLTSSSLTTQTPSRGETQPLPLVPTQLIPAEASGPGAAGGHESMTLQRLLTARAVVEESLAERDSDAHPGGDTDETAWCDAEAAAPSDVAEPDARGDDVVGTEGAYEDGYADEPLADVIPLTRRELRARANRKPARQPLVTHLPRAGIVAALGVATIVTPVVGLGAVDASQTADATAAVSGTGEPSRAAQALALAPTVSADFSVIPLEDPTPMGQAPASLVSTVGQVLTAEQLAAMRAQAEQASRAQERAVLPGCDGKVTDPNAANGRLDTDDLCEIWVDGRLLRSDAALALARLNAEFVTEFGKDLCVTDAYRSYSEQVSVRWRKPGLAAQPGTSQHGWGLAVDLCSGEANSGTEKHRWMRENAPDFGWDNPDWARQGGSGPFEPWHWEYVAGQDDKDVS